MCLSLYSLKYQLELKSSISKAIRAQVEFFDETYTFNFEKQILPKFKGELIQTHLAKHHSNKILFEILCILGYVDIKERKYVFRMWVDSR